MALRDFSNHKTIYVDVDGTLLLWPGGRPGRVPRKGESGFGAPPAINEKLVNALKLWKLAEVDQGRTLVIWSHGGRVHAELAGRLTGLSQYVDAFLPKPRLWIDDHKTPWAGTLIEGP